MNTYPLDNPIITDVLIESILAKAAADGSKPRAFDTPFRYSGAGGCARRLSLEALTIEPTNPFDPASTWVAWIGTLIHAELQQAMLGRYPNARFEVPSQIHSPVDSALTSGSCDAFIAAATMTERYPDWNLGDVLYELKTMGGFGFGKSIGFTGYKKSEPEGPRESAIIQASLNAYATGAQTVVVGELSLEAISKQRAAKFNLSTNDRIMAEWLIEKDEWLPIAEAEIDRLAWIKRGLDEGRIADRCAPAEGTPSGGTEVLNPTLASPDWKCTYCGMFDLCKELGPGSVSVGLVKR